jgi:hypothetical protein
LATIRDSRSQQSKTYTCKKEAEEYRQNTSDLIQQTRAANAAEAQADIASQQLWTGWLQTVAGLLTLAAAFGAAKFARDAAQYTKDGATAAENLLDLERRPFLSIEAVHGAEFRWKPNWRGRWQLLRPGSRGPLFLRLRSSGRSAVFLKGIHREWVATQDGNFPSRPEPGESRKFYKPMPVPIGPDGLLIASESERAVRENGKPDLLLIGYALFTDAAESETYIARFAFLISKQRPDRGLVAAIPWQKGGYWGQSSWPEKT